MTLRVVLADINPLSIEHSGGTKLPHLRDAGGGAVGTSSVFREPYGAEWVAAAAREWAGADVDILIQGVDAAAEYAGRITDRDPDVVALGMHATCVAPEAYTVLSEIRKRRPKALIVAGGYHPSGRPHEVLAAGAKAVLVGESEATFAELCTSIQEGREWRDVVGIESKATVRQSRASRFSSIPFEDYPSPDRSADAIRVSRCAPLAYPPPNRQTGAAQISYSRGCPYACSYCQSDQVFGRAVRFRRPEDVVAEMRYVRDTFGASFFFFTDLTFNLNKGRVIALCEEILSADLGVHWFAYATVDGLDPDLLRLMRKAGCTRLGIGIESVSSSTLSRAKNQLKYRRLAEIHRGLEAVDQAGILIRGYLMAGWPWETEESYDDLAEALGVLPIDQVRIAFAVPFPGVQLAGQFDLITEDLSRFTTNEPVIANPTMTPEQQLDRVRGLIRSQLNSEFYAEHVESKTRRFPELRSSFSFYSDYLAERGQIDGPLRIATSDEAAMRVSAVTPAGDAHAV